MFHTTNNTLIRRIAIQTRQGVVTKPNPYTPQSLVVILVTNGEENSLQPDAIGLTRKKTWIA